MNARLLCLLFLPLLVLACDAESDRSSNDGTDTGEHEIRGTTRVTAKALTNLVADGAYVFGAHGDDVLAIGPNGETKLLQSHEHGVLLGLAADKSRVFALYHDISDGYLVVSVPREGGAPTRLARNQAIGWTGTGEPGPMAVHDGTLYWGECGSAFSSSGFVRALPLGSANAEARVVAKDAPCPSSITFSATHVYWSTYLVTITRAPLAGGASETFYGGGSARNLVVAGDAIYWNDWASNKTLRRPLASNVEPERVGYYAPELLGEWKGTLVVRQDSSVGPNETTNDNAFVKGAEDILDAAMAEGTLYWSTRKGTFVKTL